MSHQQRTLAHYIIVRALERAPQNFGQLLKSCHSLFPDQLLATIDKMVGEHLIKKMGEEYVLDPSVQNCWQKLQVDWQENLDKAYATLSTIMARIHLPHCLDYEWWFTHAGCERLAKLLLWQNPLPIPGAIAFLGSPLFGIFVATLVPKSHVYILDKSKASLETIQDCVDSERVHLVHYDAEHPLPQELIGVADMIFFDPPWYMDYYDLFLRRSVQLTFGRYSTLGFVLFPLLTRPASLQERKQVLEIAMSYGLSLTMMESQVAHYLTPHFEQESLREKGINAKNWRKGDLAIFISDGARLPENIALKVEDDEWMETLIGRVKVKVRVKDENPNVYIIPEVSAIAGESAVYLSVSRRDPLRKEVDLWTSTQLGFKIKGCKIVWKILEGIGKNSSLEKIIQSIRQSYPGVELPPSVSQDTEVVWLQLSRVFPRR